MEVAIVADTHLPRGACPPAGELRQKAGAADLIIHAGDVVRISVLRELEFCGRTAAVFQVFNPGSPSERRRAPPHTMGLAHLDRRAVTFELIALD